MMTAPPLGFNSAAAFGGLVLGASLIAYQPSPAGRWKTVDDRTGQVKSIVVIEEVNGELRGKVDRIFAPPAKEANPLCEKCPGELRNKPVLGMQIMWGLRRDGDEYTGGRVMDPEEGKTYRCKLRLVEGGKKLQLRGYIGFSLLGRTQTWVRD
jgi:uncharacterized protein (DUF2147 family)